ncbi:PIN domain-containing protein [Sphingomonas sp. URHD0057]|uniref:PIN domain-containing protein n=1 Tax=Sphingomonas sp. URHD0057 TaxID=1380389 RepID=UPI000491AD8F|nr:PIN domain-containing protein [Sphingomonas sp. URHD0057]
MPILLDTSVAVALLEGAPALIERRRDQNDTAYLSAVSRVELIPGLYVEGKLRRDRADRLTSFLGEVEELPFDQLEVEAYERIIAATGFSRRLVVDRMIGATALANDLTLATLNSRDFRDIPGLMIEDWSA